MLVTVLTPAYNRGNLLSRLYRSLTKQVLINFEWIIIDDGSMDNTEDIINSFIGMLGNQQQGMSFPISYHRKENGGKHTAINLGVQYAKGELIFIVDSDDMLPTNAIQTVYSEYEKIKNDKSFAGIAGLDCDMNGNLIGTGLPQDHIDCNAMDIRYKYGVRGDLKEIFRREVLLEFPFPEIEGERFSPEQLTWFRIAQKYKLHYFNRPIYIAEYQVGGITSNIIRARMNSPIASMICYQELTRYNVPLKERVKAAINYYRFKACLTKQHTIRNHIAIPQVHWRWFWTKPLGELIHLNDQRNEGRCRSEIKI